MLLQFTVENFLSFKEKTVFSMIATNDQSLPTHVVTHPTNSKKRILRMSAIYGANASGKSNLIKAISFARNLILTGTKPDENIDVIPFKLSSDKDSPTRFQFIFVHQAVEYTYGFMISSKQILEEYLFARPGGKEVVYFERPTPDQNDSQVYFGPSLTKQSGPIRQFLKYKAKDTRSNQLLLTAIFDGNPNERPEKLIPVYDWFRSALTIIPAESQLAGLEVKTHHSRKLKEYLGSILKAVDTGIQSLDTMDSPLVWERDFPDIPSRIRNEIENRFNETSERSEDSSTEDPWIQIGNPFSKSVYIHKNEDGKLMILKLFFKHGEVNNVQNDFEMDEESDGTIRLINLAPMLFEMDQGSERALFIDELDRRLHPHLSRYLIELAAGSRGANQFVFTTHDTNLLDLELLRRDEIWMIEKNRQGSSKLHSLAEFKVRPDLEIERGYLNGRFGGIPIFRERDTYSADPEQMESLEESAHA